MKDVHYDNAKFRQRSCLEMITQTLLTSNVKHDCVRCSTGKFLLLLMIGEGNLNTDGSNKFGRFWRKPPRLPPRLTPDEISSNNISIHEPEKLNAASKWRPRQQSVKNAFIHAWSGYKKYAMGYDELMPLSQRGVDSLGGLGATVVDALDTAMIMGIDEVVSEAGSWIEKNLPERISQKGQVNLFETTVRVLGGLLSAYHLSGAEQGKNLIHKGPKLIVYLENARNLADHLLLAFNSSLTVIPFSDVVLHDRTAHPAPDGMSSTSEVSTLQLEFNYLSSLTGDPKYSIESMKVLEHLKTLPKVEGLVPIYINPHTGEFNGENIRLGSRGDSYYEYLIKVWLQQRDSKLTCLRDMYEEAMKGVRHLLVRKSNPNGLVFVGELRYGPSGAFSPKMDHLVCFLSGTLAIGATKGITKEKAMRANLLTFEDLKNLKLAESLAETCFEMYSVTSTGLAPEIAYFNTEDILKKVQMVGTRAQNGGVWEPRYREWGWEIFKAFEKYTKVDSGGYTSLDDVTVLPPQRRDKMETFFLGETLKYLYLLFGDNNVIALDEFVFNSEAHPFPIKGTTKEQ
ncbi:unnamed protein product [Camellia sinensis]